jgi:hypothetical protein
VWAVIFQAGKVGRKPIQLDLRRAKYFACCEGEYVAGGLYGLAGVGPRGAYSVIVRVYFGSRPTRSRRAQAQRALDRLELPPIRARAGEPGSGLALQHRMSESPRAGVRSCVATQDESFAGNVSMQDLTPSTEQPLAREGLPREPRGSPVLLEGGARLDGEAVDLPELLPEVPQVRPRVHRAAHDPLQHLPRRVLAPVPVQVLA